MIARQKCAGLGDIEGGVGLKAPRIERNGEVIGIKIIAGKIKIDQTRHIALREKYVIRKQIGMNDSRRQIVRPIFLKAGKFAFHRPSQVGANLIGARMAAFKQCLPIAKPVIVRPRQLKSVTGEMHLCHCRTQRTAMFGAWGFDTAAFQKTDQRRRFVFDGADETAIFACQWHRT